MVSKLVTNVLKGFILSVFCLDIVSSESIAPARREAANQSYKFEKVCALDHIFSFKGNVLCTKNEALVFIGHCFGYINQNLSEQLNINFSEGYVVTRCPFYAGTETTKLFAAVETPQITSANSLNDQFCANINGSQRSGLLCEKCEDHYGISVLSPNFQCQNCLKYQSQAENFVKIIGITVLPLTLLFLTITIFHIGLTSAPTNAYIFFSHIITLKINVLIIESAWANTKPSNNSMILSKLLLYPLYIWNLDFAYYVKTEVACLGKNLRIMHIFFMYYLYAIYPMLLLLATFVLVKLHDRNFKPVVLLWKPFYCLCIKIRRNWSVRTSLIDAFASCILLSYSKLIDVSLALINPNPVYDNSGKTIYLTLHYDVSTKFLSKEHLPFFIIALVVLATLGLLPPLLLLLYPFRWFQKVLNTFRLNKVQSLHIFLDAFQGCYKNGTAGSPERRYFAGFYFIFRIITLFVTSFGYTTISESTAILIVVNASFLCIIAVFQPYKNNFYNILDSFVFLILTITYISMLYILSFSMKNGYLPRGVWPITFSLLLLPTTYMTLYVFYWTLTRFRARCRLIQRLRRRFNNHRYERLTEEPGSFHESSFASVSNLSDIFPDRLNNPYRYETQDQENSQEQPRLKVSKRETKGAELAHYGAMTH